MRNSTIILSEGSDERKGEREREKYMMEGREVSHGI